MGCLHPSRVASSLGSSHVAPVPPESRCRALGEASEDCLARGCSLNGTGPFQPRLRAWILLKQNWRAVLRLALIGWAILGSIASLLFALLAIFQSPIPFGCAVWAGVLTGWLGQRVRLRAMRTSRKPVPFAAFDFEEGVIRCTLREDLARSYVTGLPWRIAAGFSAGVVCWGAQRWLFFRVNLLEMIGWDITRRLGPLLTAAAWGLPLFAGALVYVVDGPVKWWVRQLKCALERRAEKVCAEVLRDREMDGLDRAIGKMHEQLGCRRSSTYRGAIEKRLRAQAGNVVFNPHSMSVLIDALTEAARLEWQDLSTTLCHYRNLQSEIKALQSSASLLHEPLIESELDELMSEVNKTAEFVAYWGWEDLRKQFPSFERALEETGRKLRERRATTSTTVLAPGSDPYGILGVDPRAPLASIRRLRLRLAQVYHPDIGDETCNAMKMAEVNAAFDAIVRDRDGSARSSAQGARSSNSN